MGAFSFAADRIGVTCPRKELEVLYKIKELPERMSITAAASKALCHDDELRGCLYETNPPRVVVDVLRRALPLGGKTREWPLYRGDRDLWL